MDIHDQKRADTRALLIVTIALECLGVRCTSDHLRIKYLQSPEFRHISSSYLYDLMNNPVRRDLFTVTYPRWLRGHSISTIPLFAVWEAKKLCNHPDCMIHRIHE